MKLIPVSAGNMHSDGGTVFSVVPKVLWSKVYPANELNLVNIALRCLLVETNDRKILIETGAGSHYSEKYLRIHGMTEGNHLEEALIRAGCSPGSITDVLLTHLHWDHFNGSVKKVNDNLGLAFPNATYWSGKKQWEHSKISNIREKIAYYEELLNFMMDSGRLKLIEKEGQIFPGIDVRFYDGHTPGQMIPFIRFGDKTIVYMADLIPTAANIPVVWLASFDLFPVTAMDEKEAFLKEAVEKKYILFFEHDYYTECATVKTGEKGYTVKDSGSLEDLRNRSL